MDEGLKYYELKKLTMQQHEAAAHEKRTEALRALGPVSASQFIAVVEAMASTEPREGTTEHAHWTKVVELKAKLADSTVDQATQLAGTWVTRKAHGTSKKITARPLIGEDVWSSMIFLFRQSGLRVFTGQKPPRDGVHWALQGTLA